MKRNVKFTVDCEMSERWIPHFLGMLEYMQTIGAQGSSREVTLFSDGDGDFNPKFKWNEKLPESASPKKDENGNRYYDAG